MKRKKVPMKCPYKRRKRRTRLSLSTLFAVLFTAAPLPSLSKNDFIPSVRTELSLTASPFWTVDYDGKTDFSSLSASAASDFTTLKAQGNFTMRQDELHLSFCASYAPRFGEHCFFGVESRYHRMSREWLFTERDFLIGPVFRYETERFSFEAQAYYLYKHTAFTVTGVSLRPIYNHNFAASLSSSSRIGSFILSFSLSSYADDAYFLFCSPIGTLSLEREIGELSLGLTVSTQYVDFFTASAAFRSATVRPFIRLRF